MIHILWLIIKFILLMAGILLGLLLLAVLLLLFCPVRYRVSACKDSSEWKNVRARAGVSWLFEGIRVQGTLEQGKVRLGLRLLGIPLDKVLNDRFFPESGEEKAEKTEESAERKTQKNQKEKNGKDSKGTPPEEDEPADEELIPESEELSGEEPGGEIRGEDGSENAVAGETEESEELSGEKPEGEIRGEDGSENAVAGETAESEELSEEDSEEEPEGEIRTKDGSEDAVAGEMAENEKFSREECVRETREEDRIEKPVPEDLAESGEDSVEESVRGTRTGDRFEGTVSEEMAEDEKFSREGSIRETQMEDRSVEPVSEETAQSGEFSGNGSAGNGAPGESPPQMEIPENEPERKETGPSGKNRAASFLEKLRRIPQSIRERFRSLLERLQGIRGQITWWEEFLTHPETRAAFAAVRSRLFRLLWHIFPTKIEGRITFGTEDPSVTGAVLAVLGITIPFHKNRIEVNPVFEGESMMEGSVSARGRVYGVVLLATALQLLFDRNIRGVIRRWKQRSG